MRIVGGRREITAWHRPTLAGYCTLDGVGGDHLEAAIESSREFGRIAWVGAISYYNQYPDMEYGKDHAPGEDDGITLGQPPAPSP
jgi:hypothetical protein